MPPAPSGDVLSVENFGPITKAKIEFGDLTVLVGPQASGKSILLQLLKLQLDAPRIATIFREYGFTWEANDHETFLELYFGEGLGGLWSDKTKIHWQGKATAVKDLMSVTREDASAPLVSYIPAQRVLAMQNGWPRGFESYSHGDPFVVKGFSENLRRQMNRVPARDPAIFPHAETLAPETRELLTSSIFGDFWLQQDKKGPQRRLVLQHGNRAPLPFMVWSAGQREFSPLLLGVYGLLPGSHQWLGGDIDWVVIEEPEMGLHPRAISAVLYLVLELLHHGYRVCISTHSPQILDLVWALRVLIENNAPPETVRKLFEVQSSPASEEIAASILKKKIKVYSFNRDGKPVTDISRLDPESSSPEEISWGGLTEFSTRTSDVVADFIASLDRSKGDES